MDSQAKIHAVRPDPVGVLLIAPQLCSVSPQRSEPLLAALGLAGGRVDCVRQPDTGFETIAQPHPHPEVISGVDPMAEPAVIAGEKRCFAHDAAVLGMKTI